MLQRLRYTPKNVYTSKFRQNRLSLFIVLSLVLLFSITACGGTSEPETVKIAVSLPLGLGPAQSQLKAVEMALDEIDGQIGETTVELLLLDTTGGEGNPVSAEKEAELVSQAVDDATVVAYLGPPSSNQAKESMSVLNEAGIAQISQAASWPGLTKPGFGPGEPGIYNPSGQRHFFRVVPSDDVQGLAAARWADQLGFNTVYIVDDAQVYGQGIAGVFEVSAQDVDIDVLERESFPSDEPSAEETTALATRVVEAEPDFLYYGGGFAGPGVAFLKAVRTLAPDLPIMGADGIVRQQFIDDGGADLIDGIYGTNITVPASQLDTATDFAARYEELYGETPIPVVVSIYEATKVLLQSIENADERTREGVLTSLKEMGDYSGILGTWSFNEDGDTTLTTISGMQVQDGAWEFVEVLR